VRCERRERFEQETFDCRRRLLEVFLNRWGYDVAVAASGTEALDLLDQVDAPRLAVLDWMMPGLEGVQVCRKIRERKDRPYVYILLLSARAQKEDLLLGLESGADDYLTKPFDAPVSTLASEFCNYWTA
jgi:DNA-binding response OmpR family regulator